MCDQNIPGLQFLMLKGFSYWGWFRSLAVHIVFLKRAGQRLIVSLHKQRHLMFSHTTFQILSSLAWRSWIGLWLLSLSCNLLPSSCSCWCPSNVRVAFNTSIPSSYHLFHVFVSSISHFFWTPPQACSSTFQVAMQNLWAAIRFGPGSHANSSNKMAASQTIRFKQSPVIRWESSHQDCETAGLQTTKRQPPTANDRLWPSPPTCVNVFCLYALIIMYLWCQQHLHTRKGSFQIQKERKIDR